MSNRFILSHGSTNGVVSHTVCDMQEHYDLVACYNPDAAHKIVDALNYQDRLTHWQQELPTQPGTYWLWHPQLGKPITRVVTKLDNGDLIVMGELALPVSWYASTYFFGPLPEVPPLPNR